MGEVINFMEAKAEKNEREMLNALAEKLKVKWDAWTSSSDEEKLNLMVKEDYWILDDNNNVVKPESWIGYHRWMETARITGRIHVAQTYIGVYWVSTVFLGLDHSDRWLWKWRYDDDLVEHFYKPTVFETMIFYKDAYEKAHWNNISVSFHKDMDYLERYCTWKEAEEGHQEAIEWLKIELSKEHSGTMPKTERM